MKYRHYFIKIMRLNCYKLNGVLLRFYLSKIAEGIYILIVKKKGNLN